MKKICLWLDGNLTIKEVNDWILSNLIQYGTYKKVCRYVVCTSDSLSVCWFGSFVIHACHLRFSRHFLPFYIFWIKILLIDAHRNMPTSKVTKNMCQFLFLQIWFRFDFNKWSRSKFLKSSENYELKFLEFLVRIATSSSHVL